MCTRVEGFKNVPRSISGQYTGPCGNNGTAGTERSPTGAVRSSSGGPGSSVARSEGNSPPHGGHRSSSIPKSRQETAASLEKPTSLGSWTLSRARLNRLFRRQGESRGDSSPGTPGVFTALPNERLPWLGSCGGEFVAGGIPISPLAGWRHSEARSSDTIYTNNSRSPTSGARNEDRLRHLELQNQEMLLGLGKLRSELTEVVATLKANTSNWPDTPVPSVSSLDQVRQSADGVAAGETAAVGGGGFLFESLLLAATSEPTRTQL